MECANTPGIAEIGLIFFLIMISGLSALLTIIPFWKICSKAGFPGPLSLLMLIPLANIILPFFIAFARWPALESAQLNNHETPSDRYES